VKKTPPTPTKPKKTPPTPTPALPKEQLRKPKSFTVKTRRGLGILFGYLRQIDPNGLLTSYDVGSDIHIIYHRRAAGPDRADLLRALDWLLENSEPPQYPLPSAALAKEPALFDNFPTPPDETEETA